MDFSENYNLKYAEEIQGFSLWRVQIAGITPHCRGVRKIEARIEKQMFLYFIGKSSA